MKIELVEPKGLEIEGEPPDHRQLNFLSREKEEAKNA